MRRIWLGMGAAATLTVLGACSPSDTDFKEAAEETIEDKAEDLAGGEFTDAECEKPEKTDVGTTFACTATDSEGTAWNFEAEITGDKEVTVTPVLPDG